MRPSALQVALLMLCGSLLAGFSCFSTADDPSSVLGMLGFAAGLAALGYAAVSLLMPGRTAAPSSAESPDAGTRAPAQPRPTVGQGIALALCGFLLFFFSCGGAIIPVRSGSPLVAIGIPGMIAGALVMLWGIVRFAIAIGRAMSGRKTK